MVKQQKRWSKIFEPGHSCDYSTYGSDHPLVYEPCPSHGSFALQRFKRGNTVELRNGIMFDFYPGLPHISPQEENEHLTVKCA